MNKEKGIYAISGNHLELRSSYDRDRFNGGMCWCLSVDVNTTTFQKY